MVRKHIGTGTQVLATEHSRSDSCLHKSQKPLHLGGGRPSGEVLPGLGERGKEGVMESP